MATGNFRLNRCWQERARLTGPLALLLVCLASTAFRAQSEPTQTVVERMHAYLDAYEPKLSELVADEAFVQRLRPPGEGVNGESVGPRYASSRRLESDIGFLRLPGRLGWLAQRSVRAIDGVSIATAEQRLDQVYASSRGDLLSRARGIAEGNARHNLGHPRSINVPTLPLELLGRQHAAAFDVRLEGRERVLGRDSVRVLFRERAPGRIVAYDERRAMRADLRAWIAAADGAVLRAIVELDAPGWGGGHSIRTDFAPDPQLGILVPVRLEERWDVPRRGVGVATYSNYRKFQTAGRILPPGR